MSLLMQKRNEFLPVTFRSIVDQMFSDNLITSGGSSFMPAVNILESDKAFEIHVSIPGMKKDQFHLDLEDQILTISGERNGAAEDKIQKFHLRESHYGRFSRSFQLPENALVSKIEARYIDGILQVVIPKDNEKSLKKTITVN